MAVVHSLDMMGIPELRWASIEGLKICPRCQYWGLEHEKRCARCGRLLINRCVCGAPILAPFAQECFHCGKRLDHVQDVFELRDRQETKSPDVLSANDELGR